ncbi:MAG: hypothetical protein ACTHOC_02415 [Luteimonas sp.]
MKLLRSIGAIVAGYVLFAVSAFVFFQLTGQAPHAPAPPAIMAASIVEGAAAAFSGGFVAAQLAGRRPFAHGIAVAVLLASGAIASLAATVGHGAIWSQIAALALMAPAAALGGWMRARRALSQSAAGGG